jgi:hypothetical protein
MTARRPLVNVAGTLEELTDPLQLPSLSEHPANPDEGWCYYNSTEERVFYYDGTEWVEVPGAVVVEGEANFRPTQEAGILTSVVLTATERLRTGVVLDAARVTGVASQKTGVRLSTVNSGVAAKPVPRAGVRLSTRNTGSNSKPQPRSAAKLTRIQYDLTHISGASAAANAGADNWTNINNATGTENTTNATCAGALAARTFIAELTYADFPNKAPLTISSVILRFYVEQAGTVLNNGDMRLLYNLGAGFVTSETITGDVSNLTAGNSRNFDITAAIGGDWTKLNALQTRVEVRTDAAETLINAALDAVEVRVVAALTQAL